MRKMIGGFVLAALAMATAVSGMSAQSASVPPGGEQERLEINKALVEAFAANFGNPSKVEETANRFLAEDYIQHNPLAPGGRAGFIEYLTQWYKDHPYYTKEKHTPSSPYFALIAEGDLVVGMSKRTLSDPRYPGQTYEATYYDTFRVENGKLAEHWDDVKICTDATTSCYMPEN